MNKDLDELIRLAKKFPETDRDELRQFVHLEVLCDKKLEALEIIKNKRVNVDWLIWCIEVYDTDELALYHYNECLGNEINREEYDLLKEVLL